MGSGDLDRPLTESELAEKRRRLSMLHISSVEKEYRRPYEECRMHDGRLPKAAAVQELVTAWKLMWEWAKRSGRERT